MLSVDGRFIAFASSASDLVPNDTNGDSDMFVRDMHKGETTLVSVNRFGQIVAMEPLASDLRSPPTADWWVL